MVIKILKNLFKKKDSISENSYFITLVQLIKDNSKIGNQIKIIIDLNNIDRHKVIKNVINKMKKNNEDNYLIEAFSYLYDEEIVLKIKELL